MHTHADNTPLWTVLALIALTLISRAALAYDVLLNIDAGNFVFAVENGFDMTLQQPHPPGYFLFVMLGRGIYLLTGDAPGVLGWVSVIFSALSVPLIYDIGRRLFDHRSGAAAGVIALTSPLLWFYGLVGLTYTSELFFAALIAWLGLRVMKGERHLLWALAIALGTSCGFRPTTAVLLYPLWLYCIRREGVGRAAIAHLVAGLTVMVWLVPMIHLSGGLRGFVAAQSAQASLAVWTGISLGQSAGFAAIQIGSICWALLFALVPLLRLALSAARGRPVGEFFAGTHGFLILWALPPLIFFILIISRSFAPGYGLLYMGALYIMAGRAVAVESGLLRGIFSPRVGRTAVLGLFLAVIAALNTLAFSFLDMGFSLRGLSGHHDRVSGYVEGVRRNFKPDDTVIAGWDYVFLNHRHSGYYLPEYLSAYIVKLRDAEGGYYLLSRNRKTLASRSFNIPKETRYIVYAATLGDAVPLDTLDRTGARTLIMEDGRYLAYFDLNDFDGPVDIPALVNKLDSAVSSW